MKNIFTKIREALHLKIIKVLFLLVLIYAGCKKPTEGLEVAISTASLFKSPVLVHFENANTNSATQLGDFPVTISGKDAGLVQMGSGGSDFKASGGFLALALKQGVKASSATPIVFNVYAEIPGYAPVTRTITISSDSLSVYNVKAVEYAKPAEGTTAIQTQTALNAGASSLVTITTTASPTVSEVASIVIPEGTMMLDASNNAINGTSLKSNIIQYGTHVPSIAAVFPGGLSPTDVLDQNGTVIRGGVNFVTAGSLGIEMSVGGKAVKKFSKPLAIEQGLAANLINFETGNPIKVGETIPLWSLNEQTGQWKAEGNAVIAEVGGKLVAKYMISHLSDWNISWVWSYYGFSTVNKSLTVNFLPSKTPWLGDYQVQLQTENGAWLMDYTAAYRAYSPKRDLFTEFKVINNSLTYTTLPGKYGFSLPSVPKITKAKIVMYNGTDNSIAFQSAIFDPTTVGSIDMNLTIPPPPEFVKVKLVAQARCSNKNIVSPITGLFFLQNKTLKSSWEYVYLENGSIIGYPLQLIVGHQYEVTTTFNGVMYKSGTFVATKANIDIPTGSSGLVATTSYDQNSNTITINGSFSMVCK